MPLAEPTTKKLALIAKNANVGAAGSEALEENFQWWFLYGNESGFYRDKPDNKAEWKQVDGEWTRIRYRMRRREWIELHVKIKNKRGDMVPFVLNQAQRDLLAKVYRLTRKGRPVRIVILKARQLGFSTLVQAMGAERSLRRLISRVLLIGHRKETAALILDKVHRLVTRIPKEDGKRWNILLRRSSRKEIAFEVPMESVIEIDSAEVAEPGHGDTVDMLHMTETSRWPDASVKAKGLEQVVPEVPGTEAYDETTANGDTGYFRDKFTRAYYGSASGDDDDDFRGWTAHFTPWFADQEYRFTSLRSLKELPARTRETIEKSLDDEEKKLLATRYLLRGKGWVTVDYDQLAWRRFWKQTKCGDNWSTFNEQYPAFPEDAFLASGRTVFDNRQLADAMKLTSDPIWCGDIPEASAPTKQAMEALLAQL